LSVKIEDKLETISVDGENYHWKVRHTWLVNSGVGVKGISISVWLKPGQSKELVVEFPFSLFGLDRSPKPAKIDAALQSALKEHIAAGWRADSRGHTFHFLVSNES